MYNILRLTILPGAASLLLAFAVTPIVIKFAQKIGIIDDPSKKKEVKVIHTYPVPRGGGLAIFVAIFLTSLIFLPLDKHLIGILSGAFILTLMGIIDDKYNLNPYLRLISQRRYQ